MFREIYKDNCCRVTEEPNLTGKNRITVFFNEGEQRKCISTHSKQVWFIEHTIKATQGNLTEECKQFLRGLAE